jgi:hypothetical protein
MAQGDLQAARNAFARASSVLLVDAGSGLTRQNAASRVLRAYTAAHADQLRFARFTLVNPSPEAQADFAVTRAGRRVIPNDSLEYRAATPGARSGQSIQQANILRLRVSWCRPVVVPFIRQLLIGSLRVLDADPWHQYCYSQGRIPIRSEGASPMQSDFRVSS